MQFSSIVYDLISQMQARFLHIFTTPEAQRAAVSQPLRATRKSPLLEGPTGALKPVFCACGILSVADKSPRRDIFAPLAGV